MYRLEKWSICGLSPYSPPEAGSYLAGIVYDHPDYKDGHPIRTSRISEVIGDVVVTSSRSRYKLGEPSEDYVEWCKRNGYRVPTKEEPIRMHD